MELSGIDQGQMRCDHMLSPGCQVQLVRPWPDLKVHHKRRHKVPDTTLQTLSRHIQTMGM
jgi:hypothetical protein